MPYYPIFLDISHATCLIVGAGAVGRRKLASLLLADAGHIVVLDTAPLASLIAQDVPAGDAGHGLADSRVRFVQQAFEPSCVVGHKLVFAATGNRAVNAAVAKACQEHGIWCNCTDAPADGSFIVPATARQGKLVAALSTGGASPALARTLRHELEDWLAPRAAFTTLMGRVRPLVLALDLNTEENTRIFRELTASDLQVALANKDRPLCESSLRAQLPAALHPNIVELLYDLI